MEIYKKPKTKDGVMINTRELTKTLSTRGIYTWR